MEILEGRKLNEAVLKAFGPIESSADAYLHDRPCYEDGLLKCHQSDDLTWQVVDGLREKGWYLRITDLFVEYDAQLVCPLRKNMFVQAHHAVRDIAILNACLLAMEAGNAVQA